MSGDQLSLDTPVQDDDVFASGGTVNINAPVASAVVAGGNINIHSGSVIAKDVFVAGGTVNNAGEIVGKLTISADNFQNTGKVGEIEIMEQNTTDPENALYLFQVLLTSGFGVLGVVLLKLFPAQFTKIDEIIRKSTVKKTVVGFLLIIASTIGIVIAAVTVVGLPIAIIAGFLFVIGLMLAGLFVTFTFGKKITAFLKLPVTNNILTFIICFVILVLLYLIPYAGQVIQVIVVSLGFGALFYGLRQNWASMTSMKTA